MRNRSSEGGEGWKGGKGREGGRDGWIDRASCRIVKDARWTGGVGGRSG